MMRAKCHTELELKEKLRSIRAEVEAGEEFKKYWEWLYTFHCDVVHGQKQKSISVDNLIALTPIALKDRGKIFPWLDKWMQYLEILKTNKKTLSKDTWKQLPVLGGMVAVDLSNYEEISANYATPSHFDEFVKFCSESAPVGLGLGLGGSTA